MVVPDQELAAAIRAGDESAACEFCARFQSLIAGIARRRRVPVHDCDDVAQDVLAQAIHQIRLGQFRGTASLSTWLHHIIRGKIADYLRRARKREALSLDCLTTHELRWVESFSPEDILWVRQTLEQLSTEDQFILRLHDFEELTLEEIGPLIALKKSAVDVRLQHARANFRRALRRGGNIPSGKRLKD